MTQLADLFLTEKEKTLILLAIDTHMYSMHQNGCAKAAIDIFGKLEERITSYNTKDAELIMHSLTQLADEADERVEDEDDSIWDVAGFVAALTEDDAVDIYEALCERLGDDADDASLKEQLQQSLDITPVSEVNPNGDTPITSTQKLGIKGDHTPWYDRLPCDSEPADLEELVKNHLRTVK